MRRKWKENEKKMRKRWEEDEEKMRKKWRKNEKKMRKLEKKLKKKNKSSREINAEKFSKTQSWLSQSQFTNTT